MHGHCADNRAIFAQQIGDAEIAGAADRGESYCSAVRRVFDTAGPVLRKST